MRFRFHPEALAEYQAAASYYATRTEGLQFRYLDAVEHAIAQIVDAPELGVAPTPTSSGRPRT
jgi:plasmid stabilization system protein ParE